MNERIQELALAAGKYADETQPRGSYTRDGMWLYAYNEKFAKLIVRECVTQCSKVLVEHTGQPSVTHNYAVGLCQDSIKEHFGVEE